MWEKFLKTSRLNKFIIVMHITLVAILIATIDINWLKLVYLMIGATMLDTYQKVFKN